MILSHYSVSFSYVLLLSDSLKWISAESYCVTLAYCYSHIASLSIIISLLTVMTVLWLTGDIEPRPLLLHNS